MSLEVIPIKGRAAAERCLLVLFETRSGVFARGEARRAGAVAPSGRQGQGPGDRSTQAEARGDRRIPEHGGARARGRPGGAAVHERGGALQQRRAAERERGVTDRQGGDPVRQRRAVHAQPGAAGPERRARAGQRRPPEPPRQRQHPHRHGGARPARAALHPRGREALQPHPHRRRAPVGRPPDRPRGPRAGAGGPGRDRHREGQRARGPGPAGRLLRHADLALPDPRAQDRRRGGGAGGRGCLEAQRGGDPARPRRAPTPSWPRCGSPS